ncbi:NDR1/HIN1-like protein 13 [Corylus avellana]|uniref:NDR1/HIN1-like protein 13 n=1 Tax=Corylus avellana TaxID=13451 RepID=UPI00286A32B1|nr:NDR1/HIN1-like protein 13 [Corylus avellana]
MAERDTPISHDEHDDDPPSSEQPESGAFRPGTYVVQVPKNQIYRVPPPENALIAERHRNPARNNDENNNNNNRRCGCCSLCSCVSSLLIVLLIVLGLIAGIVSVLLGPKDPTFYVERVVFKANSRSPEYDITLRVKNPNKFAGILYKKGGVASLSFRQREIGRGNYPTFFQDHKNSTVFGIVFRGSNEIMLPMEIERSVKNRKAKLEVSFSLKMDVMARMRIGILKSGSMKFAVACDLTVDTLAIKDTRVLAQKCHTKRRLR